MTGPFFVRDALSLRILSFSLLGVVMWLWPLKLGGSTSFVVLQSDSMRPRFRRGDIVLVRRAPRYQIGDIVLYRGQEIPYIFHRIVAYDAQGRFRTQGDANDYLDPDPVNPEDILGRYVVRFPRLGLPFLRWGRAFGWLLLGLVLFIVLWPPGPRTRHRRRRLIR